MKGILKQVFSFLFNVKLINFEKLNFNQASIIMPNHISFLDAVFLYLFLPTNVCFVVNTEIAKKLSWGLKFFNHIAIDPSSPYSIKKIITVVRNGTTVVLFPEGRISTTGNLMKIYSGIGVVALKTGALIYPVILSGLQFSKLSRITDKVKTQLLPKVNIFIGDAFCFQLDKTKNIKNQKKEHSSMLLEILQKTKYLSREKQNANLFNELLYASDLYGTNKVIVEDINGKATYKRLIIGSYIFANKLKNLLTSEENIGILLPNSIGNVVTLFSLFFLGKTPSILNFSAGIQNNIDCIKTSSVKIILTSSTFIEKAGFQSLIEYLGQTCRIIYLEDIKKTINIQDKINGFLKYLTKEKNNGTKSNRLILFTSGSESRPKGVVLKHENILANVLQLSSIADFTNKDKMLNPLPMFHSLGLTAGTFLPILEGFEVYLYPSPLHFKIIPEIAYDKNITILLGTPTFLNGYAKYAHPYDFYKVKYCLAGGEKLKEDTRSLWVDKFGIRIMEGYGTTETAPVLAVNTNLFNKKGSVGKLLPFVEHKLEKVDGIDNGGNLLVKCPNLMEGYLIYEKGFIPAEEWYSCGDVVEIDKEGYVFIKSRLKRFAKISGEMISLNTIEEISEQCFGTDKHASISVSDSKKGEIVILFTSVKEATKQQYRNYLSKTNQSMLLLPSIVIYADNLPLLGSGKIDYIKLRERYLEEKNHE